MAPLRPLTRFLAQLWFALDTASALRHRGVVSERARELCMTDQARSTESARTPALA